MAGGPWPSLKTMGAFICAASSALTLAQEVQQNLIPEKTPEIDGFEIAGRSLYSDETGGDYIDYLPDRDGTAVVAGDVSDHGIAAKNPSEAAPMGYLS